jgi:hypothetical protein
MSVLKTLAMSTLFILLSACPPVKLLPVKPQQIVSSCVTDKQEQARFNEEVAKWRVSRKNDIIAVGQNIDRQTAKQQALSELAGQIASHVVSQTNVFVSEFMKGIQTEVIDASSHTLSVSSNVKLIGAEIIDERQNSCQEFQFVLALPRKNVPAILERVQEESLKKRHSLTSLSIRYEYATQQGEIFQAFQDGDDLHSGDFYKIIFESSQEVYVYIFQFDSANKIYRLFPKGFFEGEDPKNTNPVKSGRIYFVPGQQRSFELDNQIGTETIHIVVSKQREPLLENQYKQLVALQDSLQDRGKRQQVRLEVEKVFKWRGPKEKIVYHDTPESMGFKEIKLCDGCVYSMDFYHITQ